MINKLIITDDAMNIINQLNKEYGEIILYLGSGCCDGTTLNAMAKKDYKIGNNDMLVATYNNIEFYANKVQKDYFAHMQLIVDVKNGNGSEYSLEFGTNKRFVLDWKPINNN